MWRLFQEGFQYLRSRSVKMAERVSEDPRGKVDVKSNEAA